MSETPTHPRLDMFHSRYGGHGGGDTPGPIPNPEAKPSSADGTAPARVWESRTPPDNHPSRATPPGAALDPFPDYLPPVSPEWIAVEWSPPPSAAGPNGTSWWHMV